MGFFKKKKHSIIEADTNPETVAESVTEDICEDDFDMPDEGGDITRKEFHQVAEENFREAIAQGIAQDTNETDDSVSRASEEKTSPDTKPDLQITEQKEEKKPRLTFTEFRQKHSKGLKIAVISSGTVLAACLCLYIYGCATVPQGVMGRNIYIEDTNVSGLTFDEALAKVKGKTLLNDCNITVTSNGKTYTIDGLEVGLSARVEDTVDRAMRYGKTGNILIDGFANALQVITRHTVMPSANVNEEILREKLNEFGKLVHGELVEHKLEVGDNVIICTPGHTGFSGNTDRAYEQVIEAINNNRFSGIRVTFQVSSPKKLKIEDIDAFAYANPEDARFEVVNNTVTVVPEVWGRYLNLDEAKTYLSEIHEGGDVVNIPFYTTEPTIKADQINEKLFNATLASYYTSYGGSTSNRAANVANAASKINEKVLAPGEVFSFNDTVGKRSVANGFFQAPEYSNGQTVMGIGGGTCQVSSTLYNAVLYADLSIVSRLNHMFTVGYCPAGQDATVSDSGVDFKFMNNTDYPIKIVATTGGGRITVNILGTQRDIPHTVKIENNSTYSNGNQTVRSYRLVYDPQGNLLRKDDLGKSFYMSHSSATTSQPQTPTAPQTPAVSQQPQTQAPSTSQVPITPPTSDAPVSPQTPTTPQTPTAPQLQTQ